MLKRGKWNYKNNTEIKELCYRYYCGILSRSPRNPIQDFSLGLTSRKTFLLNIFGYLNPSVKLCSRTINTPFHSILIIIFSNWRYHFKYSGAFRWLCWCSYINHYLTLSSFQTVNSFLSFLTLSLSFVASILRKIAERKKGESWSLSENKISL